MTTPSKHGGTNATLRLRLTAFVPPWPFVLSERLGLHRAEGVEVVLTPTTSSPEQLQRLQESDVDLAVTAVDNLFAWNRDGADVGVVAMAEETTPLRVVARAEFTTLDQLHAARLGVDAPENGFVIALLHLLGEAGVRDARLLEVGGVRARFDSLLAGDIDATLLGPPFDRFAQQAGMVQLADLTERWPSFPGQGVVVRRDRLTHLEAAVDALLRAWRSAIDWARTADDAAIERLLDEQHPSAAELRAALPVQLEPDPKRLEILARMRRELEMLPDGADADGLLARW